MIPSNFVELDQLPRTSGGKVDRQRLPVPVRPQSDGISVDASQSALESAIVGIWCEALNLSQVGRNANFFDLGGHSLLALRVAATMTATLNRSIPVTYFFQYPTPATMAKAIVDAADSNSGRTIVELKSGNKHSPLFFFPPIGAEMFFCQQLIQSLPDEQSVFAVDWHAGRTPQHSNVRSLREIAADCAKHIREFLPSGPYHLAGYSFGGRLAYETACCLLDSGAQVGLLALIDAGPGSVVSWTTRERWIGLLRFLQNVPAWAVHELRTANPATIGGRLRRKVRQLSRRLRNWFDPTGTSMGKFHISDLFDDGQFPAWFQLRQQADLAAAENCCPQPARLKVTLFQSKIRPLTHGHRTDLSWKRFALLGVEVHVIPGDHGTMLRPPHVDELSRQLNTALASASTEVDDLPTRSTL